MTDLDFPDLKARGSGVDGLVVFVDLPSLAELTYLAKVIAQLPGVRAVHSLKYVKPAVIEASRSGSSLA